ncbi:MAG TPA: hypothetical protein VJB97_01115 [Candidatus Paceibacterota bacterium]
MHVLRVLFPVVFLIAIVLFILAVQRTDIFLSACKIGECPAELTEEHTKGRFIYALRKPFSLKLNYHSDPPESLTCTPEGVISYRGASMPLDPPYYRLELRGLKEGECVLKGKVFRAHITIKATDY